MNQTKWKSMKNCAQKWCQKLCAFLFEVTCDFWKMWIFYSLTLRNMTYFWYKLMWQGSCCIHDNCYMMCKKSKGKCDKEFFSNLRAECNTNPMGSWCNTLSTLTAKTILSTSRARKAYEDSQKNCKTKLSNLETSRWHPWVGRANEVSSWNNKYRTNVLIFLIVCAASRLLSKLP